MSKHAYERRIRRKREEERRRRRRHRRTRLLKVWGSVAGVLVAGLLVFLFWPSGGGKPAASKTPTPSPSASSSPADCTKFTPALRGKKTFPSAPCQIIDDSKLYDATLETSMGAVTIEMDPRLASKTVNNFVFLARAGFYNGLIFHRVIKDFMIQGGDPESTGSGGPGYQFEDETAGGQTFDKVGLLAMANSGPNTNGSQFFITVSKPSHLNGKHTIFGKVVKGYDVVERISRTQTAAGDRPVKDVRIRTVTITERAR